MASLHSDLDDSLVRPKRILLDSRDLINIRRTREGRHDEAYEALDELIRNGFCTPVFHEPLAYEWVRNGSVARAQEIAAIFDSAIAYVRILPDTLVCLVEGLRECARILPGLPVPEFEPILDPVQEPEFHRWLCSVWPEKGELPTLHGEGGEGAQVPTVSRIIDTIAGEMRANPSGYAEAIAGHRSSLEEVKSTLKDVKGKQIPQKLVRGWLCGSVLLDRVLREIMPGVDAEEVISKMDLSRCPAAVLTVRALVHYARATGDPSDHDWVDLTMLPAIPYVDAALVENNLWDLVRRAMRERPEHVFRSPTEIVSYLTANPK